MLHGFVAVLLLFGAACTKNSGSSPDSPADRGRRIYQVQCTTCHNPNPALPGAVGPEIAGSSRELLEPRILRGEYPTGYKPKRSSKLMAPMPGLAKDLDALAAFLQLPESRP